jgi:hypothetical protein
MTRKCTEWPQNIPNGRKIDQMAVNYTSIFYGKTVTQCGTWFVTLVTLATLV